MKLSMPWSVCVPGPSLDWSKVPSVFPSIAVNVAIDKAPFCDYWCCRDTPNAYTVQGWDTVKRLMPVGIFTVKFVPLWEKWLIENDIKLADMHGLGWDLVPWVLSKVDPNPKFSVMFAMAFAISRGAKFITLYGCDMQGSGYHSPELNAVTQDWDDRWTMESNIMKKFVKEAYINGIRIAGLPHHIFQGVYEDYGIILGNEGVG